MKEEWKEMDQLENIKPRKKWQMPKLDKKQLIGLLVAIISVVFVLFIGSLIISPVAEKPPEIVCEDITPFVERNDELYGANIALNANISTFKAQIKTLDRDRLDCKQELIQAINNKSLQQCSNQFYVTEIDKLQLDLYECNENINNSNCWNDLNECNENIENAIEELQK